MRDQTEPTWALEGRSAALAAFDRGDDNADMAHLTEETVPGAETFRSSDGTLVAALRFAHEDITVDLRVQSHGRLRSVSGLATGEYDHVFLRVRRPGSTEGVWLDDDGGFALPGLARGPISLSLHRAGHRPVVTGWFTI
ncbi:hypothetical protein [Nocardiopsis halotolerans]|uniref:hypothetical protein n=1 Tax=Nocardiopsis halotolerans TaxID=124252 RepID=UPI00034AE06F|nr:hypothetical protein [Nocardiopsis halotolerans]